MSNVQSSLTGTSFRLLIAHQDPQISEAGAGGAGAAAQLKLRRQLPAWQRLGHDAGSPQLT
jgi:hypothetical protein